MDHPVVVRPSWLRPSPTNAKPTSSPSRVQSCSPCGSENPRPMLEMSLTRPDLLLLAFSSSTSWTVLQNQEVEPLEMLEEPLTESSTRFLLRWTVWAKKNVFIIGATNRPDII